jgi:hypothetical protein
MGSQVPNATLLRQTVGCLYTHTILTGTYPDTFPVIRYFDEIEPPFQNTVTTDSMSLRISLASAEGSLGLVGFSETSYT